MQQPENEIVLVAHLHDKLPLGQTALLGLQHVLAMDVYVVPFIIASVLGLAVADSATLIQSAEDVVTYPHRRLGIVNLAIAFIGQHGEIIAVRQLEQRTPIGGVGAGAFRIGG